MQNVKNSRVPFIRSARATLTRLTFTHAREYFIGHKKYRSALGCKSLKSHEGSGSPPFSQTGEPRGGLLEKKGGLERMWRRKVTVFSGDVTRGGTRKKGRVLGEEVGDGAVGSGWRWWVVGGGDGGAEGSRRDVARGRTISSRSSGRRYGWSVVRAAFSRYPPRFCGLAIEIVSKRHVSRGDRKAGSAWCVTWRAKPVDRQDGHWCSLRECG